VPARDPHRSAAFIDAQWRSPAPSSIFQRADVEVESSNAWLLIPACGPWMGRPAQQHPPGVGVPLAGWTGLHQCAA